MGVIKRWGTKEFYTLEEAMDWINEEQLWDFKVSEVGGKVIVIF